MMDEEQRGKAKRKSHRMRKFAGLEGVGARWEDCKGHEQASRGRMIRSKERKPEGKGARRRGSGE